MLSTVAGESKLTSAAVHSLVLGHRHQAPLAAVACGWAGAPNSQNQHPPIMWDRLAAQSRLGSASISLPPL